MKKRCLNPRAFTLILLLGSGAALAQAPARLQTYQRFEEARAAANWPSAVTLGREAVALADANADDGVEVTDLLMGLGDALAKSGAIAEALQVDERALALLTARLPADDPDLVPTLQALGLLYQQAGRYTEAEAMLQRILEIERAAYGERHENVLATLEKLRQLYVAVPRPDDAARIAATIEELSAATRDVTSPNAADRARRYQQSGGFATVRVFYGTNRAPTGDPKPAMHYGRERGDLEYGYLDVSIPERHSEGELETQSRWSVFTYFMDDTEKKRRFVLLQDVVPLRAGAFQTALRRQVTSAPSHEVFVFVHGFNSSFQDAARRTAQLAYDLDFDGTPMMYSWPSQASTTAYTVDEAAVGISGRRMAQFLKTVVEQSGADRVHLIAHSMGNRALIESLQTYLAENQTPQPRKVFGQIVFTAPDVDRDYFVDALQPLKAVADRVTLYASTNDLALKTSQTIHGAPRAGLGGDSIITFPGLDSIDMSAIKADLLGHSYFAADAGAIYDLFRLLWRGDPPPQRCGMVDSLQGSTNFWTFNVSACKGTELLEAGVLMKRFGVRARSRVRARINSLKEPAEKQEWTGILTRLDELLQPAQGKQQAK